jgi:hypothetical protein
MAINRARLPVIFSFRLVRYGIAEVSPATLPPPTGSTPGSSRTARHRNSAIEELGPVRQRRGAPHSDQEEDEQDNRQNDPSCPIPVFFTGRHAVIIFRQIEKDNYGV